VFSPSSAPRSGVEQILEDPSLDPDVPFDRLALTVEGDGRRQRVRRVGVDVDLSPTTCSPTRLPPPFFEKKLRPHPPVWHRQRRP
jgi:hypothetical protein